MEKRRGLRGNAELPAPCVHADVHPDRHQRVRNESAGAARVTVPSLPLMTIDEITARICAFRDARDWMAFHNPKDLAVAIAAEAGELMQPFVWKSPEQAEQIAVAKKDEIRGEIADVAILLFELAHNLGISVEEAMLDKLARNEIRYPVEKARGSNAKYNEL
jgi:dCTP diphosphatase